MDAFPVRSSEPERATGRQVVVVEGAGAADPTLLVGAGLTVTRLSAVGKLRVTWNDSPGKTLVGFKWGLQATTPSNVAGYTAVVGDYDASGPSIDVWVYNAASPVALDDLESGWKLHLEFAFV